jgi:hypothetical protein
MIPGPQSQEPTNPVPRGLLPRQPLHLGGVEPAQREAAAHRLVEPRERHRPDAPAVHRDGLGPVAQAKVAPVLHDLLREELAQPVDATLGEPRVAEARGVKPRPREGQHGVGVERPGEARTGRRRRCERVVAANSASRSEPGRGGRRASRRRAGAARRSQKPSGGQERSAPKRASRGRRRPRARRRSPPPGAGTSGNSRLSSASAARARRGRRAGDAGGPPATPGRAPEPAAHRGQQRQLGEHPPKRRALQRGRPAAAAQGEALAG